MRYKAEFFLFTVVLLKQQQNLGLSFSTSKLLLSPAVAWVAVRSKAMVLFC